MIMQHVLGMQSLVLNGEWGNALILSICFESMKTSNLSMWHLREMHNSLIDYYCILSWNKSSSKKLIYFIIHSSFFVRAWVRICRGNIHVWERQFQLKVSWNGITKAWIWKYIAYRRRSVWDGRKYNFKNCKKFLYIVKNLFAMHFCVIAKFKLFRIWHKNLRHFMGFLILTDAIDRSHFLIISSIIEEENYYYWKSVHLSLLQGLLDIKCVF
jgi:hypothetical protein